MPSLLLSVQGKVQGEKEGKGRVRGLWEREKGKEEKRERDSVLIPEEVKVWNQPC